MPDKKLTDNEIVKALECCSVGTFACDEQCPCFNSKSNLKITSCRFELIGDALDLINRQKAEIEEIKYKVKKWKENYECSQVVVGDFREIINKQARELKAAKAEAYKDCIDKIQNQIKRNNTISAEWLRGFLDNLLKELVGEDNVE